MPSLFARPQMPLETHQAPEMPEPSPSPVDSPPHSGQSGERRDGSVPHRLPSPPSTTPLDAAAALTSSVDHQLLEAAYGSLVQSHPYFMDASMGSSVAAHRHRIAMPPSVWARPQAQRSHQPHSPHGHLHEHHLPQATVASPPEPAVTMNSAGLSRRTPPPRARDGARMIAAPAMVLAAAMAVPQAPTSASSLHPGGGGAKEYLAREPSTGVAAAAPPTGVKTTEKKSTWSRAAPPPPPRHSAPPSSRSLSAGYDDHGKGGAGGFAAALPVYQRGLLEAARRARAAPAAQRTDALRRRREVYRTYTMSSTAATAERPAPVSSDKHRGAALPTVAGVMVASSAPVEQTDEMHAVPGTPQSVPQMNCTVSSVDTSIVACEVTTKSSRQRECITSLNAHLPPPPQCAAPAVTRLSASQELRGSQAAHDVQALQPHQQSSSHRRHTDSSVPLVSHEVHEHTFAGPLSQQDEAVQVQGREGPSGDANRGTMSRGTTDAAPISGTHDTTDHRCHPHDRSGYNYKSVSSLFTSPTLEEGRGLLREVEARLPLFRRYLTPPRPLRGFARKASAVSVPAHGTAVVEAGVRQEEEGSRSHSHNNTHHRYDGLPRVQPPHTHKELQKDEPIDTSSGHPTLPLPVSDVHVDPHALPAGRPLYAAWPTAAEALLLGATSAAVEPQQQQQQHQQPFVMSSAAFRDAVERAQHRHLLQSTVATYPNSNGERRGDDAANITHSDDNGDNHVQSGGHNSRSNRHGLPRTSESERRLRTALWRTRLIDPDTGTDFHLSRKARAADIADGRADAIPLPASLVSANDEAAIAAAARSDHRTYVAPLKRQPWPFQTPHPHTAQALTNQARGSKALPPPPHPFDTSSTSEGTEAAAAFEALRRAVRSGASPRPLPHRSHSNSKGSRSGGSRRSPPPAAGASTTHRQQSPSPSLLAAAQSPIGSHRDFSGFTPIAATSGTAAVIGSPSIDDASAVMGDSHSWQAELAAAWGEPYYGPGSPQTSGKLLF